MPSCRSSNPACTQIQSPGPPSPRLYATFGPFVCLFAVNRMDTTKLFQISPRMRLLKLKLNFSLSTPRTRFETGQRWATLGNARQRWADLLTPVFDARSRSRCSRSTPARTRSPARRGRVPTSRAGAANGDDRTAAASRARAAVEATSLRTRTLRPASARPPTPAAGKLRDG